MRAFIYNCRRFDEEELFRREAEGLGMELGLTEESPTLENCGLAEGSDFISVITTPITAEMMDRYKELGVRMICTRTIGYNHIDIDHARRIGMAVSHITYSSDGVAEYTVMMILAAVRRLRLIQERNSANDFRLEGLMGRQLRDLTVGIVGAGAIGRTVMRDLSGFGCKVVYYNRSPSPQADGLGERMGLDGLLAVSDVVSLHLEHNPQTHHIIGAREFALMKEGAVLVNTARGPLVDTGALLDALEGGRLGGAALDVIEDEFGYYYNDCRGVDLGDHVMERLRSRTDVLLTHHMAFYYDRAISDMVRNCLEAMKALDEGAEVPFRLA
ncbi:MAG: lactate dehydrogenase [Candidatus Methanomethylophilaceae archaeon]|nr:lactate dehydrogenase [Candidatus Methanomethylophilaceae archaeon]